MSDSSFALPLPNQRAAREMAYPDPSELPDPNAIQETVDFITNSTVKNKKEHFLGIFPEFAKKYPRIFEMACNGDTTHLPYMISMLRDIKERRTNQYDASVAVGQRLADAYIRH